MSSHATEDAIENCLFGRLTGPALVDFEAHLLVCPACKHRVYQAEKLVRKIRATGSEADAAVRRRRRWEKARGSDRRREPRLACAHLVSIRPAGAQIEKAAMAFVHNESAHGAGLRLAEPIAVGTALEIHGRVKMHEGIVRHCFKRDGAWSAGIEYMQRESDKPERSRTRRWKVPAMEEVELGSQLRRMSVFRVIRSELSVAMTFLRLAETRPINGDPEHAAQLIAKARQAHEKIHRLLAEERPGGEDTQRLWEECQALDEAILVLEAQKRHRKSAQKGAAG